MSRLYLAKKVFSLLFFFLLTGGLYADTYPDYYEGQIELLYFKPTIDQSFYAINGDNFSNGQHFPDGTRFNNDPRFQPAFRIEGVYGACGCYDLDFRFAYFNEGHIDAVNGDLHDTIGFPGDGAQTPEDTVYTGTARYNQHFRFYAADATVKRLSFDSCPENFSFFLGLHFAYLKAKDTASSDGTSDDTTAPTITNRLNRESLFWGIGPEFGIDYRFLLPCMTLCGRGFSLGTNARVALLASHTSADFHYVTTRTGPVGVNLDNEPLWRVTPCLDIKVGLTYECPFRCLNMTYEFGYELIWYSKCVDAITGYDAPFAGDSIDLFSNFSLQGPYFALRVGF